VQTPLISGAPLQVSGQAMGSRQGRNWFSFVLRHNEEARCWVLEYRESESWELMMATFQALKLLRGRNAIDAFAVLNEVSEGLALLRDARPSIRHVVERYYYPVTAYGYYVLREFDAAEQCLDRAAVAVAAAISHDRFLVPLADICLDFSYQKARVARSRQNWRAMKQHLDHVKSMLDGHAPLCELPGGIGIVIGNLQDYYATIPLNEEERLSLAELLDSDVRLRMFQRTCSGICILPEFVIPYP
jgi:hypothetical protein